MDDCGFKDGEKAAGFSEALLSAYQKEGFTSHKTAVCIIIESETPTSHLSTFICFAGTNVALRKPANQSTTVRGGAAANGNDGERTTVHDGKRCTETMKEASPWWMVDLLKPYPIGVVRVTTRGCCGKELA